MIRPIMRDVTFLAKPSVPATPEDKQIAIDLLETLKHNEEACVGMAANMIGISKRIIAVNMGFMNMAMFNPVIVSKKGLWSDRDQLQDTKKSKWNMRTCSSRSKNRNSPDGLHRSFSMNVIIWKALSFNRRVLENELINKNNKFSHGHYIAVYQRRGLCHRRNLWKW